MRLVVGSIKIVGPVPKTSSQPADVLACEEGAMPRAITGRVMNQCLVALFLAMFVIAAIHPQAAVAQATATVSGSVRDSSGAVLPAANIVLHDTATNLDRTTSTNSVGNYVIPQIQPG